MTNEESKGQRSEVICLRSHTQPVSRRARILIYSVCPGTCTHGPPRTQARSVRTLPLTLLTAPPLLPSRNRVS